MRFLCCLLYHDYRPDRVYIFGVCRRCGHIAEHPQPQQHSLKT